MSSFYDVPCRVFVRGNVICSLSDAVWMFCYMFFVWRQTAVSFFKKQWTNLVTCFNYMYCWLRALGPELFLVDHLPHLGSNSSSWNLGKHQMLHWKVSEAYRFLCKLIQRRESHVVPGVRVGPLRSLTVVYVAYQHITITQTCVLCECLFGTIWPKLEWNVC